MQNRNDIAIQHQDANRDWIAQVWKSIGSGGKIAIGAAAVICFSIAASNVSDGAALFTATASCIAIPTIFYLPVRFYKDLCGVNTCTRAMELLERAYRAWQDPSSAPPVDLPEVEPWSLPETQQIATEPTVEADPPAESLTLGPDFISGEFLKDEATLFREKIDQLHAELAIYLENRDQKNANKTLYRLATLLYKKERIDEAISHCQLILKSEGQTPSIRIKAAQLLLDIYSKAGNPEAVKFYKGMISEAQRQKMNQEEIFEPRALEEKPRSPADPLEPAPLSSSNGEDDSFYYAAEFGAQDEEFSEQLSRRLVGQYREAERALVSKEYNTTIEICKEIMRYKDITEALYDRDYQLAESMLIRALMLSGEREEARPYLYNLSPIASKSPSRFLTDRGPSSSSQG